MGLSCRDMGFREGFSSPEGIRSIRVTSSSSWSSGIELQMSLILHHSHI